MAADTAPSTSPLKLCESCGVGSGQPPDLSQHGAKPARKGQWQELAHRTEKPVVPPLGQEGARSRPAWSTQQDPASKQETEGQELKLSGSHPSPISGKKTRKRGSGEELKDEKPPSPRRVHQEAGFSSRSPGGHERSPRVLGDSPCPPEASLPGQDTLRLRTQGPTAGLQRAGSPRRLDGGWAE